MLAAAPRPPEAPATAWTEAAVRAVFDATTQHTVGVEEEFLLVDARTGRLAPVAEAVARAAASSAIAVELPDCQVELRSAPHRRVADVVDELVRGRRALRQACGPDVVPVAATVHPFDTGDAGLATSARARSLHAEYGAVVRRQVVGALQVHVALGDADLTLAVHNALRGHLPELAALAAAAPFHEGVDTGFASIRPVIAGQLPRQGIPPAIASWAAFADDLRWGAAAGSVPEPRRWWWELRPHLLHGTLEVRVPDVQPTVAGAAAIVSVVHALVLHLADRHRDGAVLPSAPGWRIAENRWAALRDGVHGRLADLDDGTTAPTRQRLLELFERIEPWSADGLDGARRVVERPAVDELRRVGVDGAVPWLAEVFAG